MLQHLFYGKFEFYIEMFAAQKRPYHIKFIEKQNQVDVCRLIRALTRWLFFFDTNNRRSSKYSLYSSRHFFVSSWIWIADYREKKNQTKIESKEENKSEPNQLKFNHAMCYLIFQNVMKNVCGVKHELKKNFAGSFIK